MKKLFSYFFISLLTISIITTFTSCKKNKSLLDPDNPVTLSMWHVYGEQADSPMNRQIEEFNKTIGKEKGIIINITLMSSATYIGSKLLEAQADKAGAPEMPDLFFCHASNALDLGINNLINWRDVLTENEVNAFVGDFVKDGTVDNSLVVLPVSKSTHLLFVAGGVYDTFMKAESVTYDDLATWDGIFSVTEKYYDYSGGKPFLAIDYLMRCVELNAISKGATNLYTSDGWYDFSNEILMASYKQFAEAIAKGHIIVADLYANTQIMTGQVIAGIGSSASILYYNDKITYPDNTQIDMNLHVFKTPQASVDAPYYATQAGVGLCAYKTTKQKEEACTVFAQWFTEENRNLDFVASTGYMPVLNNSFDKIDTYNFKNNNYQTLYQAISKTKESCTLLSEPNFSNYYNKVYSLYDNIRLLQKNLTSKYNEGKSQEEITNEIINYFISIK